MTNDSPANPGELREDVPLRPNDSVGFSRKLGGVNLIIACFTVLSIAVTIALATQIYYGDFEVVPHGSVATDSRECSRVGTNILKDGGNAVDAAIAASFCLSVINPHTTGLDAGGIMMIYDYRKSRSIGDVPELPIVIDFSITTPTQFPQLVKSLAFIHDRFGQISWKKLVEPAASMARYGFTVPNSLVSAVQTVGSSGLFTAIEAGHNITNPNLANYLDNISNGSVSSFYPDDISNIFTRQASGFELGDFTIYTPSVETAATMVKFLDSAIRINLTSDNFDSPENVYKRALNLRATSENSISSGATSSVAVIDKDDVYVSLITGLHVLLGSQRLAPGGYIVNEPPAIPSSRAANTDAFVPLIITQHYTCGQRVVLSCGEMVSAAQVIGSLLVEGPPTRTQLVSALERPRLRILSTRLIAFESSHDRKFEDRVVQALKELGPLTAAAEPYPTCNAIQQLGDALASHADSRGGGLASRF